MSQHGCPERLSNRSKGFQEEGSNQPTMEVLVETLTGTAFEMTVSPSDTIFAIKSKIFRVEGIPVSQQHILYNLKEVEDSASLDDLSITDGARLRLVLGLRGGPISTRRLPPPPPLDSSWRDIERLLDTTREDTGHSGCKVTVLLVRDGERLSMLRMRENDDGSYSPLDNNKYSSTLNRISEPDNSPASPDGSGVPDIPSVPPGFSADSPRHPPTLLTPPLNHHGMDIGGSTHRPANVLSASTSALSDDNAITLGKMLALRSRMHIPDPPPKKQEIKKTRSEEHLTLKEMLDEPPSPLYNHVYPAFDNERFSPLYDGHYIRYDLDCSFHDRYALLPPIGSRSESEHSVGESVASETSRVTRDSVGASLLNDVPSPSTHSPYGGVGVCGGWGATHSTSALSLLGAGGAGGGAGGAGSLSSSTSQLETLHPSAAATTLHRHPNTQHLHRSHEGLDVSHKLNKHSLEVGSERRQRRIKKIAELENKSYQDELKSEPPKDDLKPVKKITKIRCGFCKKRLSIATVHKCRCGAEFCAPHRYAEVHGCAYDYKANAHQYLERANPLVSAPKLPKI